MKRREIRIFARFSIAETASLPQLKQEIPTDPRNRMPITPRLRLTALVLAGLAATDALAGTVDSIPKYDIGVNCARFESEEARGECQSIEKAAYANVKTLWSAVDADRRRKCVRQMLSSVNQRKLLYVLLDGCLKDELADQKIDHALGIEHEYD